MKMMCWTKWWILFSIVCSSTVTSLIHRAETEWIKNISQNSSPNEDSKLIAETTLEKLDDSLEHEHVTKPSVAIDNVELTDWTTLEKLDNSTEQYNDTELSAAIFSIGNEELPAETTLEELAEIIEHHQVTEEFIAIDNSSLEFPDFSEFNDTEEEWENYTMFVHDRFTNTTYSFREGDDINQFLADLRAKRENEKPTVSPTAGDFDILRPVSAYARSDLFCPHTALCPSDQHDHEENHCCMRCNCQYRPACPSSRCCKSITTNMFHHVDYKEECITPLIGDRDMFIGSFSVFLTQSCKLNDSAELIRKCQQTDGRVNELDRLIPVRSHRSGVHYKNIHCAECNGDKGPLFGWQLAPLQPWESHLICKNDHALIKNLQRILYDEGNIVDILNSTQECYLHWHTDSDHFKCIKLNNILDRCLDPNFEDKKVRASCRREMYSPVKGLFGIYSNVFCLVCNEGVRTLNETCKKPFTDIHESFYDIRQSAYRVTLRLPKNVIEILITARDVNGLTSPTEKIRNNKRTKMCPITTVRIENECETVIRDLRGIALDFRFRIVYPKQAASLVTKDFILLSVRGFTQGAVNKTDVCVERVIDEYEEGTKLVAVVRVTRMTKRFVDIKSEYDLFVNKIKLYNQDAEANANFMTPFVAELAPAPLEIVGSGPVSFAVYTDSHKNYPSEATDCGRAIAMVDLQFCETFLFEDVVQLDNGLIMVKEVNFVAGEYLSYKDLQSSVYICRDLFNDRRTHAQKLQAPSSFTSRNVPMATFTFVTIWFLTRIVEF